MKKKLLISYLKKQKREYNEQVVILQKELTSTLMYNHRQEYIIKNLMYESIMNVIRIYENLIEKIDLYEGIDEYYTETLERNNELAVARADAELQLIKKIIDKVEKI